MSLEFPQIGSTALEVTHIINTPTKIPFIGGESVATQGEIQRENGGINHKIRQVAEVTLKQFTKRWTGLKEQKLQTKFS